MLRILSSASHSGELAQTVRKLKWNVVRRTYGTGRIHASVHKFDFKQILAMKTVEFNGEHLYNDYIYI